MSLTARAVPPAELLGTLRETVVAAKAGDPLAGVIVVVPTNRCGVMTRRALGRGSGAAGIDTVTLPRLAELIGGPSIAAEGRRPLSAPVLDLALTAALREVGGRFGAVARHPSTIRALRKVADETRTLGPDELAAFASREPELARVLDLAADRLRAEWYDAADVVRRARDLALTDDPIVTDGRPIVLHLPERLSTLDVDLLRALATRHAVSVVGAITGDDDADVVVRRLLERLDVTAEPFTGAGEGSAAPRPRLIISTTDADDEVHQAVRVAIDAARGALTGEAVPFERIALLWSAHRPYARLVEHHLRAAALPFNGRSGTEVVERIAPRFLLDLLDLDRRGISRGAVFDLLADVPARGTDGRRVAVAPWERVSRVAGVGTDDWDVRLDALPERWQASADELRRFVADLAAILGPRSRRQPWRAWADWCDARLDEWLPLGVVRSWPDPEYRAWEQTVQIVERLRHLDTIGPPVDRGEFRRVLEASLDEVSEREGRVGTGITVGALAGAAGLDVDVVVVLGCADGVLPPPPRRDPLIDDATRTACGLATALDHSRLLRHHLLVTMTTATTVLTSPRGDLRATSTLHPSAWIEHWIDASIDRRIDPLVEPPVPVRRVASHAAGMQALTYPASRTEHRLARRWRRRQTGASGDTSTDTSVGTASGGDDPILVAAMAMRAARAEPSFTAYDGNVGADRVPRLGERPIAATQLEAWVSCPFAYFGERLLGVRPIEEPGLLIEIERSERGSLTHRVLDLFHREVIDGSLPQPTATGWTEVHRARLLAHFDDATSDLERRGRVGRPATWAAQRERLRDELLRWLDLDGARCRAAGITVLASEHRFGDRGARDGGTPDSRSDGMADRLDVRYRLPDGRTLPVHGSIDRIDREASGRLVVTDHKTGKDDAYKQLGDDDPTLGGTRFQLPVYAAAARSLVGDDAAPVRAEYAMFAAAGFRRHGVTFTPDTEAQVSHAIAHVVAGIEAGWFAARPERPGFQLFVRCWYCNPDGLGTDVAWDNWEHKRHDPALAVWFGDDR
jgi:hypothetical protein